MVDLIEHLKQEGLGNPFKKYIQKPQHCTCGKTHNMDIKYIHIKEGAIQEIPKILSEKQVDSVVVVADKNTYKAAGQQVACVLEGQCTYKCLCFDDNHLVPDEEAVGRIMIECTKETQLIIAIGTGTINDLCKYVSYKLDIPYIIVATAPSMDGFASTGAALIHNHLKTTYETHTALGIIGDVNVLKDAPMEMIIAGIGDILGKYTCLCDWKISGLINDEYYCEEVVSLVENSIEKCLQGAKKGNLRDEVIISDIMEALVLTGIAMSFVGNSRPASGAEHHLSHFWEMEFLFENKQAVLHGTKVALGTLSVLKMYEELKVLTIDKTKILEKCVGFSYSKWEERVKQAANGVIALEERTQKNNLINHQKRLEKILNQWERILAELEEIAQSVGVYFEKEQDLYRQNKQAKTQERLENIKCFVLDMDGTIYLGEHLFEFTKDFLEALKLMGKDYVFLTNNSSKNAEYYIEKLKRMNIEVAKEKMFTSNQVIINYLKGVCENKSVYIVGTEYLVKDFEEAGFEVNGIRPDYVVLGFDTTLQYEKLRKACDYIREGIPVLGVNKDLNCPVEGGFIPDCGAMGALVEASTGQQITYMGKPSYETLKYIMIQTGYSENELAFIGDRLYTDIAICDNTEACSIMVLTGETQLKDLDKSMIQPDLIYPSLKELAQALAHI